MATYTQEARRLALETPLGKDVLLLTRFSGHEEMSRLFRFNLEMLSEDDSIAAKDIIGKNVTIALRLLDDSQRFFNGHVSKFSYCGTNDRMSRYTAEVVPWLWFLTQTSDCRIFQKKSIPKIVEQVFSEIGFTAFEISEIKGAHPDWENCVQYRETDFNFVSRLMEHEGIFYYFRHENGKHTLVLGDQVGAYRDCLENEVEFAASGAAPEGTDMITSWEHQYAFRPGKWAHTDYCFETPSTSLLAKTNTLIQYDDVSRFEVYDFPGEYEVKGDGENDVKLRMEEYEVSHDVVSGASKCRTFTPGHKFTLKSHYAKAEEGGAYVLASVHHAATLGGSYVTGASEEGLDYSNAFTCIPDSMAFRPARITPKPVIQGAQTAIVVGPAGEEIYTDKYGRVKVQFHWDREGKKDENSSCWIRVSHPWAGKGWGAVAIPRIGQEVIVDFLEGDPDRPLVTGRVYNAECMPPYELPGGGMVSGLKSDSTPGGGGYNEMSMDDTKGKEKITIHGQYDMGTTIEHDKTEEVRNNETITIGNDRTETVAGNETLSVGKDRTRSVSLNEIVTVALTRTHTVGVNEAITVGAAQEITVGGLQAITVGLNQVNTVGANRQSSIGKDDTLNVSKKLMIDAGDEILIKTGEASISMKKDGTITIKGKDIAIEGSGKIDVKADKDIVMKGQKILQN